MHLAVTSVNAATACLLPLTQVLLAAAGGEALQASPAARAVQNVFAWPWSDLARTEEAQAIALSNHPHYQSRRCEGQNQTSSMLRLQQALPQRKKTKQQQQQQQQKQHQQEYQLSPALRHLAQGYIRRSC
jgi:hypothetical protein